MEDKSSETDSRIDPESQVLDGPLPMGDAACQHGMKPGIGGILYYPDVSECFLVVLYAVHVLPGPWPDAHASFAGGADGTLADDGDARNRHQSGAVFDRHLRNHLSDDP